MNYTQTMAWLFQKLPMFQRQGSAAYKANLDNITSFCAYLGNPQDLFKTVHVAGTNGKGSSSHMLASIFQEAGYKTGLHTSPHLKDFRERNRVNGQMMPEQYVIDFIETHKKFIEELSASFFEVAVAMGFQYFADQQVDIAIIETGLGGRLDSTNIIKPVMSVITNIGLDHTAILGDTLEEIAQEKAGIIKPSTAVVIGETTPSTRVIFSKIAQEKSAPIIFVEDLELPVYNTDLKGAYQKKNAKTVVAAVSVLQQQGWQISEENLKTGLENVVKNTGLRGRWDILQTQPLVIADTAHNAAAIKYIVEQIASIPHQQLHLVLGFVSDKDVVSILQMFPDDAIYYLSEPDIPRKLPLEKLKKLVPAHLNAFYFSSIAKALNKAKASAQKDDLIYVGGSTFVVAEIV